MRGSSFCRVSWTCNLSGTMLARDHCKPIGDRTIVVTGLVAPARFTTFRGKMIIYRTRINLSWDCQVTLARGKSLLVCRVGVCHITSLSLYCTRPEGLPVPIRSPTLKMKEESNGLKFFFKANQKNLILMEGFNGEVSAGVSVLLPELSIFLDESS